MVAPILFALDWSRWDIWVLAGVGLAGVICVLMLSRTMFGGRQAPTLPAAAETAQEPASDPFLEGSKSERRVSLRRRGRYVQVSVAGPHDIVSDGWVVDRSTGGLCIALPREVKVGTVVSIRPSEAPATVQTVEAEVRNCRRSEDGWELGCSFVKTPPWSVLLHFG